MSSLRGLANFGVFGLGESLNAPNFGDERDLVLQGFFWVLVSR